MKKFNKNILIFGLFSSVLLFGHGDNKHVKTSSSQTNLGIKIEENKKIEDLNIINEAYVKDVKPIFKIKCFDCHGELKNFPWYYNIPGIKQLMDYDMKEAKKHIDMSKDFPFLSHETPLKDLKSLKETLEEDEMPPIQYVLGHWDSRLTEDEKKKVFTWIESSLKILGETK